MSESRYLSTGAESPRRGGSWLTLAKLESLGFGAKDILRAVSLGHIEGHLVISTESPRFKVPLADVARMRIADPSKLFVEVPAVCMISDATIKDYVGERVVTSGVETRLRNASHI